MEKMIYRNQYRGQLKEDTSKEELSGILEQMIIHIKKMIQEEKIMTAALYYYNKMLFLYYEAMAQEIKPMDLVGGLTPCLEVWPGLEAKRVWVHMPTVYYHAVPQSVEDWTRPNVPELRRGRIAFLYEQSMFEYVYHHVAIVNEGLLTGDKYQFIGLHENILFSYFEEPKTIMNVRRDLTKESEAIQGWLEVNPEAHFISKEDGGVGNFMFLPAYFALGQEEKF